MAAPAAPTGLALQQGNSQVLVSWTGNAAATSYHVYRSDDGGVTYSDISQPATTSYLDTSVASGSTYFYKVSSHNGTESAATSAQSITPVGAGQMTLGQLRTAAQQRADMTNSQFVTTLEWNSYINQSAFELYDLLTTVYEDYNVQAYTFSTVGGQAQYALPNGSTVTDAISGQVVPAFYKLMGVDLGLASTTNAWVTIQNFDFIQRNRYVYPQLSSTYAGVFNLRYRLVGNKLMFIPAPSGGQYVRIWYVPRLTMLLQDSDILDGVSGWTEYVIVDAAIKAMQKEESDVTVLAAQKMALIDRINGSAQNRDVGQPNTISDIRTRSERWGGGFAGGDGNYGGY